MSSRSSRAASPTARRRGSNASGPKGNPTQNASPRATRGWTRRSRIADRLRLELLARASPVPETDSRSAAEQAAARLAGVLGPVAPGGEAHARRGRRRSLREVAAAPEPEEEEPRARGGDLAPTELPVLSAAMLTASDASRS